MKGHWIHKIIGLAFCGILLLSFFSPSVGAETSGKWTGVDESVVEKIAREHGRESRDPLINTDQGDLLLFVFLLAGAAGGCVAGYYWRKLMEPAQTIHKNGTKIS